MIQDSQQDLHTETHRGQTKCTPCVWWCSLRTQQISSFVELAQFDTYQKLVFSSLNPRSCMLRFCEQFMLTKIFVSRNGTEIERKCQQCVLLVFLLHYPWFDSASIIWKQVLVFRKSQGEIKVESNKAKWKKLFAAMLWKKKVNERNPFTGNVSHSHVFVKAVSIWNYSK